METQNDDEIQNIWWKDLTTNLKHQTSFLQILQLMKT